MDIVNTNIVRCFNGTSHQVNIIDGARFDRSERKYKGGRVMMSIPQDYTLFADIKSVEVSRVGQIPIYENKVINCDTLPDGYDMYIVSRMFANVYKGDKSLLYTIGDIVISNNGGEIIGCRGLRKVSEC